MPTLLTLYTQPSLSEKSPFTITPAKAEIHSFDGMETLPVSESVDPVIKPRDDEIAPVPRAHFNGQVYP